MSLLLATQITAIATAVLALFAIVTTVFAALAWRSQSREVGVLRQQLSDQQAANRQQAEVFGLQALELRESLDERKRDATERHRSQAARVFISEARFAGRTGRSADSDIVGPGPKPPSVSAIVHNSSDQPVYDAELAWHLGTAPHGSPNPEPLGVIMPGNEARRERSFPSGANMELAGAVVRFTDASGVRWLRRPDGDLTEQPPQAGS